MTGPTEFCPQCYSERPLDEFLSKNGARFVQRCRGCRDRYGNWGALSLEERASRMRVAERNGIGYMARLVSSSNNRKLGGIPASTTDMASCPDACSFRDVGCYAAYGKTRYHWRRVAETGSSWADFCRDVAALPEGTLWRHNDAGDLPGRGDELDVRASCENWRGAAKVTPIEWELDPTTRKRSGIVRTFARASSLEMTKARPR